MDELVNASRDIPSAPVYAAPLDAPPDAPAEDIDQTMAETTARRREGEDTSTRQQTLDADPDARALAPQCATAEAAAPVEAETPTHAAPVPEQDLSGLEQLLRDMTSRIETLRQPPLYTNIGA